LGYVAPIWIIGTSSVKASVELPTTLGSACEDRKPLLVAMPGTEMNPLGIEMRPVERQRRRVQEAFVFK
jgi:hypothetical protein